MIREQNKGGSLLADWDLWVSKMSPKYPHEKVIQFVFRNFSRDKAEHFKFLDLGCGNGVNSLFLHQEKYEVYGVDISSSGISDAQKRTNKKERFKVGSIDLLDFADNFFDGLICIGVLETVSPETALKGVNEASRVLKTGGKGLFLFAAKGDYRESDCRWIQKTYTEQEVKNLFQARDYKDFYLDEYITTYQNKKIFQKDWLITVFK